MTTAKRTKDLRRASCASEEAVRRLAAVSDTALARLPLEELLNELLVRVRSILGTDTAAILLLKGGDLVARAAKGLEEEVAAGVRIPLGSGFAGRVAAEKRPIFVADVGHAQTGDDAPHRVDLLLVEFTIHHRRLRPIDQLSQ